MYSINRQIAVIKAKQPYIDWIKTLHKNEAFDEKSLNSDCSTFLIPHFDYTDDSIKFVQKHHKNIFEMELEGWTTDERIWPPKRTLALFKKWFEIEIHSEVIDLVNKPIEKEEY